MCIPDIIAIMISPTSAAWISCCDDDHVPFIARLSGVKIENNQMTCFVPLKFTSHMMKNLIKGRSIALMAVCPESFKSYQIKGTIENIGLATSDQVTQQKIALKAFSDNMKFRNLSSKSLFQTYSDEAFVVIDSKINSVFDQSPMEGTGQKIHYHE